MDNNSKNQEIKRRLVNQHVIHNASMLIYELNKKEVFFEEISELFYKPDYDQTFEDCTYDLDEEEIKEICEEYGVETLEGLGKEDIEDYCNKNAIDIVYYEPFEFWIVSDYLAKRLEDKQQIVGEFLGFTIWGRLTTGQAILLDGVISEIAEDMKILEGMENEWSTY